MGETTLIVNVSDMIDLAIGSPEVGVVDFNMLQTVLHCLAQQLRILGKNVEIRGSMTSVPATRERVQTISVSEYAIDDAKKNKKLDIKTVSSTADQSFLVVERVRKPKDAGHGAGVTVKTGTGPHMSDSKFNLLQEQVMDLQNKVFGPKKDSAHVTGDVKTQTEKPVQDTTKMSTCARLSLAEDGISKLTALVDDLIALTPNFERKVSDIVIGKSFTASAGTGGTGGTGGTAVTGGTGGTAGTGGVSPGSTPGTHSSHKWSAKPSAMLEPTGDPKAAPTYEEITAIYAHLNNIRNEMAALANTFYATMNDVGIEIDERTPEGSVVICSEAGDEGGSAIGDEAGGGTGVSRGKFSGHKMKGGEKIAEEISAITAKQFEQEKKIKKCCEDISVNHSRLIDHISTVQDQVSLLVKEVFQPEKNETKLTPELLKQLDGMQELYKTISDLTAEIEKTNEITKDLVVEKETRQDHLNTLIEQIELLKIVKMDKEDISEALAEKADLSDLARKVSHDRFEMACDDLSKGLENAIEKLTMQEALWQQALDDVQRDIEQKLDKKELEPVKEYFFKKLKELQASLKRIAAMRLDIEAAGAKKKLIRDVNCVSCDADVSMKMLSEKTHLGAMPANHSKKPYLTYELDNVRKSQMAAAAGMRSAPPERVSVHEESGAKPKTPQPYQQREMIQLRAEREGRGLCNRYCGGSHTVTNAAQRVARAGNFIKQWGPDVLPLSSEWAAGDDGRVYRIVCSEYRMGPGGVGDTCTPKKEPKRPEAPPPTPPKTIIVSNECRCLDGGTWNTLDLIQTVSNISKELRRHTV